ncbi:hypothetical protein PoB_002118400 [Plakobranchus ocellatus]|uniref:Uncharacterized protein n=1 Tax=Plakobranchus ocellatus TaxID=259542 RepID=A0AAV3ZH78_9GAST|nr:hypothetical protein PoB_002118400 [Plakobranchus ocellatus]
MIFFNRQWEELNKDWVFFPRKAGSDKCKLRRKRIHNILMGPRGVFSFRNLKHFPENSTAWADFLKNMCRKIKKPLKYVKKRTHCSDRKLAWDFVEAIHFMSYMCSPTQQRREILKKSFALFVLKKNRKVFCSIVPKY